MLSAAVLFAGMRADAADARGQRVGLFYDLGGFLVVAQSYLLYVGLIVSRETLWGEGISFFILLRPTFFD